MRIGELSQKAGLTVHTLRFYERRGLLPAPARGPSNYREYSMGSIDRLRFIREAKRLGFTLAEIQRLFNPRNGPVDCTALRLRGVQKLREIEEQIRQLQTVRRGLKKLLGECAGRKPARCEVVRSLRALDAGQESVNA